MTRAQTTHISRGEDQETAKAAPVSPLDKAVEISERRQSLSGQAAAILGVAPTQLCKLLRNVWRTSEGQPELTDQEMFQGISLIARYELDPIAREIYVTRDSKGRLMTIVAVDGWIRILDRTDHYDGFEQEMHLTETNVLEWVETRVHSTKRKYPAVYRAFAHEYAKLGGYMAGKIPWHMLRIFSLRHAARMFVALGGSVVTEEEARWMETESQKEEPIKSEGATMDDLTKKPAPEAPPAKTAPPAKPKPAATPEPPAESKPEPKPPAEDPPQAEVETPPAATDEAPAPAEETAEQQESAALWEEYEKALAEATTIKETNGAEDQYVPKLPKQGERAARTMAQARRQAIKDSHAPRTNPQKPLFDN